MADESPIGKYGGEKCTLDGNAKQNSFQSKIISFFVMSFTFRYHATYVT